MAEGFDAATTRDDPPGMRHLRGRILALSLVLVSLLGLAGCVQRAPAQPQPQSCSCHKK